VKPVNIGRGEQFSPAFLEDFSNNRMPAIVDHDPPASAIRWRSSRVPRFLQYLAEKVGQVHAARRPRQVRGAPVGRLAGSRTSARWPAS